MIRLLLIAVAALAGSMLASSIEAAREADQLPPLAVTAADLGEGFVVAGEATALIDENSFVRVLHRPDPGFASVTVTLYGNTSLTPDEAVESTVQGLIQNPSGVSLVVLAPEMLMDYGADAVRVSLSGMANGRTLRALVTAWRSGDVLAVMTAVTAVADPETPEDAIARLRQLTDRQRDKLVAMGLPLATGSPAPATP